MDWNKIVGGYYKEGYYIIEQVKVFVSKGKITAEQYKAITGQDYVT